MTDIEQLRKRLREAEAVVLTAKEDLAEAIKATAPFQIGDVMRVRYRGEWIDALVREVVAGSWSTTPRYRVSKKRKNGSWSLVTWEAWAFEVEPLDA